MFFSSIWFFFIAFNSLFYFSMCSSILLLSSLTIFMIITLNSVSGRLPVPPFHLVLLGLIFFLCLGCVPLLPHFAEFAVFISVSLVSLFCFPGLESGLLWETSSVSQHCAPLWSPGHMLSGAPCRLHRSFCYGGRHGGCDRSSDQSGCQALLGEEAAGLWLAGPGGSWG